MADFDQIRRVKQTAQPRLLALPGVHAVGIGAKVVGGVRTSEPSIKVFVVKKKAASELPPNQLIPTEIEGVKTDVVERAMPKLHVDPDTNKYSVLEGGIQIQAGKSLFGGTLGCIARTIEPEPRVVAVTCEHVVGEFGGLDTDLEIAISADQHHVTFVGDATRGSIVRAHLTVFTTPTGPSQAYEFYIRTVPTDNLVSVAAAFASGVNALGNPAVNATHAANSPSVTINWVGPDTIVLLDLRVFGAQSSDETTDLHVTVAGQVITLSGEASERFMGIYTVLTMGGAGVHPTQGVFTAIRGRPKLVRYCGSHGREHQCPRCRRNTRDAVGSDRHRIRRSGDRKRSCG